MKSFNYVVTDPVGIHARPAGNLVQKVKSFADAKITLKKGEKSTDAKKLMMVMALGAKQGDEVTFEIEGENEEAVAAELEAYCKENL